MCRYSFLTFLFSLLLGCVASTAPIAQAPTDTIVKKKWNILFISIDDLNTWTGHLDNHPGVQTPNVDRLATKGVSFRHAYSPVPHCKPTRAAIMSGLRPWESGSYHGQQSDWFKAIANAETIPQFFSRHGYRTMGTGKIFHNGHDGHLTPGYWDEFKRLRNLSSVKPRYIEEPNDRLRWGPAGEDENHGDFVRVSWAIDKLNENYDTPFFLGIGLLKPHLAWFVPEKYFAMHPLEKVALPKVLENDLDDVPPIGKKFALNVEDRFFEDHRKVVEADKWKQGVQAYLAASSFADAQLGRLLNALEQSQYSENTLIVLWGDHGWHLGEKSHWRKHALWEEATNTSYIIYSPGLKKNGRIIDTPVDLMSIYPTLAELTGLPKPKTSGVSIVPLLENENVKWKHPAIMTYHRGNHAVRMDSYRYIRYSDGTEELYDHRDDPKEWHNIANKPEMAKIKEKLASYLPKHEAPSIE